MKNKGPIPPGNKLLPNKSTVPAPANVIFLVAEAKFLYDIVLLHAFATRRTTGDIEFPIDFASHSTVFKRRNVSAAIAFVVFGVRRAVKLVGALFDFRIVEEDAALTLNLFHDGAAAVVMQLLCFGERRAGLLAAVS